MKYRRKEEFSAEELAEHARIAKEYNRQSMLRHQRLEKDLTLKIWLMKDALDALPANLKEHANSLDTSTAPESRPMPRWHTPAIKGFKAENYMKYSGSGDNEVEIEES